MSTHRNAIALALASALVGLPAMAQAPDPLAVHKAEVAGAAASADQVKAGEKAYQAACMACHQPDGKGMPGAFPPLAGSDYLAADTARAIRAVLHGLQGPVVVNDVEYNSVMPPMTQLSDSEVADALTYAMNSWGNRLGSVSTAQVAAIRAEGPPPRRPSRRPSTLRRPWPS
jgi:mono/diheme cytochrome c family protein